MITTPRPCESTQLIMEWGSFCNRYVDDGPAGFLRGDSVAGTCFSAIMPLAWPGPLQKLRESSGILVLFVRWIGTICRIRTVSFNLLHRIQPSGRSNKRCWQPWSVDFHVLRLGAEHHRKLLHTWWILADGDVLLYVWRICGRLKRHLLLGVLRKLSCVLPHERHQLWLLLLSELGAPDYELSPSKAMRMSSRRNMSRGPVLSHMLEFWWMLLDFWCWLFKLHLRPQQLSARYDQERYSGRLRARSYSRAIRHICGIHAGEAQGYGSGSWIRGGQFIQKLFWND